MATIDLFILLFVTGFVLLFSFLAIFKLKPPQPLFFIVGGILLFSMFALTDTVNVGYFEPQIRNITEVSGGTVNIVNYNQTIIPIQADIGYTTNEGARVKLILLLMTIFMMLFGVVYQLAYKKGKV